MAILVFALTAIIRSYGVRAMKKAPRGLLLPTSALAAGEKERYLRPFLRDFHSLSESKNV
ncbi:hypothetical protein PUN28_003768 [Cardiocondyla obscurior]|uniref:Uncharacterized protein n=1 Tax=Cardiocondyla obscurior TaxID=286306 RepID=A0AAW2GN59_9HYME